MKTIKTDQHPKAIEIEALTDQAQKIAFINFSRSSKIEEVNEIDFFDYSIDEGILFNSITFEMIQGKKMSFKEWCFRGDLSIGSELMRKENGSSNCCFVTEEFEDFFMCVDGKGKIEPVQYKGLDFKKWFIVE